LTVINLILAEAALELIPSEIASHPSVVKSARRRGKHWSEMLLDVSLHYSAMRRLRDRHKRGRPDITHIVLLEALSSPLNIEGYLNVYIHTVGDYVIFVDPTTRMPRNYNRFVGLIEQLFKEGKVPPNSAKPLMEVKPMNFKNLIKYLGKSGIIALSERGELTSCSEVCRKAINEDLPIVIGGFPHGDFNDDVYEVSKYVYSIYGKPLDTWVVTSRIISKCEEVLGITK